MSSYALPSVPTPPANAQDPGSVRARALGHGSMVLAGLGVALLAARQVSLHAPPCPFRAITGVPCPGCGMTRLAVAVSHGHVEVAARADIAGVAILVVIATLAIVHLATAVIRRTPPPAWMRSWALPVGIVALVAAHWITTIITGGLPPS